MIKNRSKWLLTLCMISILVFGFTGLSVFAKTKAKAEVVLYGGPSGMKAALDRSVTVNGKPLFLYEAPVNLNRAFSEHPELTSTPMGYFDFSGTADIVIKAPGVKITSAVVRPLSLGITPKINGDTLEFAIDKPGNFTIELNNEIERAIHIFANPIEKNPPKKTDSKVLYYGPGVHKAGIVDVKSGQTVYIAGGAVVYGAFHAEGMKGITVTGRGILCGSIYNRWKETTIPIDFRHCEGVNIDGVIFMDPAGWTVNTYFCDHIKIDNIKIISARPNGDGITMQSCTNMTASNCFVRTWDDSLVVKDYDNGSSKNITFSNINIWTDLAQSCEIGYETLGPSIENVTFKDINILHNFHKPAMSIHNSDNAAVKNIHYSNITVEDAQMGMGDSTGANYLIDLSIGVSQWSISKQRGTISDVYFDNISLLSGQIQPSRIRGDSEENLITNVFINNFTMFGKPVKTFKEGIIKVYSTSTKNVNIAFDPSKMKVPVASVQPVVDSGLVAATKFTVITPPKQDAPFEAGGIQKTPVSGSLGKNLAKDEDIKCNAYVDVYTPTKANDGDPLTYWEGAPNQYPNQLTVNLLKQQTISHVVVRLNPDSIWGARTQTFEILGSKDGQKFTTLVKSKEYKFDPASGNFVTVDISSAKVQYVRLQFTANTGANAGQVAEFEIYP